MIFVNFKTYPEATGERAVDLARIINECAKESGVRIISVPQATDIADCVELGGEVWAQRVGATLPETVLENGGKGTFLNHSDHKIDNDKLQITNDKCRKIGLKTLIFASDIEELGKIIEFKPDFAAYEPPELIASKDSSVAGRPEVIRGAVSLAGDIPLIVGAGIKSEEDVRISLREGAKGIAVSSAVVLADDPKKEIMELVGGFLK